jgi:hypothetical protein
VIADDTVAQKYTKIIEDLGVSISSHKTHVSSESYEFAKRWFTRDGQEYTPFQFSALYSYGPKSIQVCEYLIEVRSRG